MRKAPNQTTTLGRRLLADFSGLRDALRSRSAVERRYTVRTVKLDLRPRQYNAQSVREIRLALGVSQAIFAQIVGASTDLVAAWEQGNRKPTQMACRLLEMIERDKNQWIKKLRGAMKTRAA